MIICGEHDGEHVGNRHQAYFFKDFSRTFQQYSRLVFLWITHIFLRWRWWWLGGGGGKIQNTQNLNEGCITSVPIITKSGIRNVFLDLFSYPFPPLPHFGGKI